MAFSDNRHLTARPGPIAAVIAIHAGIGYLLVTGLATTIITQMEKEFGAVEFPTKPPEDPVEPPPQTNADPIEQPFVAPRPPVDFSKPTEMVVEPVKLPPFDNVIVTPGTGTGSIPDPIPQPRFDPVRAAPRNNPAAWVTTDDYPSRAIREEAQGTARFRLEIAANGKVESCTITRSSGNDQLDAATCKNIQRRAKFDPAKDSSGNAVSGSYESSVRWTLPE